MSVRILRVIEYTYESGEQAIKDQEHWNLGANAAQRHGTMTIRSSTMPMEFIFPEEGPSGRQE